MNRPKSAISCDLCGNEFEFGFGIYSGVHLSAYQVNACNDCTGMNYDGWAPQFEIKLCAALEKKGLPIPDRLPNGRLPCNPPVER